jgi:hypothetical protein
MRNSLTTLCRNRINREQLEQPSAILDGKSRLRSANGERRKLAQDLSHGGRGALAGMRRVAEQCAKILDTTEEEPKCEQRLVNHRNQ